MSIYAVEPFPRPTPRPGPPPLRVTEWNGRALDDREQAIVADGLQRERAQGLAMVAGRMP